MFSMKWTKTKTFTLIHKSDLVFTQGQHIWLSVTSLFILKTILFFTVLNYSRSDSQPDKLPVEAEDTGLNVEVTYGAYFKRISSLLEKLCTSKVCISVHRDEITPICDWPLTAVHCVSPGWNDTSTMTIDFLKSLCQEGLHQDLIASD